MKFGYAFNQSPFGDKPKQKMSSCPNLSLRYLKRVHPSTQMGFFVKVDSPYVINSRTLDIKELDIEQGYFIIKNKGIGSIEYGRKGLVSQDMLINTSKICAAAGRVSVIGQIMQICVSSITSLTVPDMIKILSFG